ncbi:UNKNOWN [Stylonychia lemnae]|uniref:Uncharacterized protein n=1 Tax=Stylonychia lemnae TaxID=5949 RepID=A0A078A6B7_STYLE|nr:UNKNOWN [Stylonychia lemnae]|eukprot:CDW77401.1 UNKNOWN [Stylonychia lemnae]
MGNIQERCCIEKQQLKQLKPTQPIAVVAKQAQPVKVLKKPSIESDYTFTDYVLYAQEKVKQIQSKQQHRGKRQIDYLPRRNKLRSVEIDISQVILPRTTPDTQSTSQLSQSFFIQNPNNASINQDCSQSAEFKLENGTPNFSDNKFNQPLILEGYNLDDQLNTTHQDLNHNPLEIEPEAYKIIDQEYYQGSQTTRADNSQQVTDQILNLANTNDNLSDLNQTIEHIIHQMVSGGGVNQTLWNQDEGMLLKLKQLGTAAQGHEFSDVSTQAQSIINGKYQFSSGDMS